jgi:glycosyltransferase involved in cell wall biosynthesis
MTDILFVHNNFPAQYKLLARHLAQDPAFRVFAIGSKTARAFHGAELVKYDFSNREIAATHPFARQFEVECRRAEQVIYAANSLKLQGADPSLVFAHPGWGETLPLRQVFPRAKLVTYCEFFYRTDGADVGFDPEFGALGVDGRTRVELKNASTLLALAHSDVGIAPTAWQKSVFPEDFHPRIRVIHEGIDEVALDEAPDFFRNPLFKPAGVPGHEIVTYVARSLEPYRGFHVFMRALPDLLRARPRAQVAIVGDDNVSYGSRPAGYPNWRTAMLAEVGASLDLSRVHFLGRLAYRDYLSLLKTSRVHVYLTYPFVLSWSLLEALMLGCTVVASDTVPVREVIAHRRNGLLVPFFDPRALAAQISDVLARPHQHADLAQRARDTARRTYSFRTAALPAYRKLIDSLVAKREQSPAAQPRERGR